MIQNACEKHLCAWRSTHYKSNYMKNRCFHNLSKSTLALLTYCGYGSRFYILLPNRRQDYIFYNHYFLKKFLLSFMYQKRKRTPPTHTHTKEDEILHLYLLAIQLLLSLSDSNKEATGNQSSPSPLQYPPGNCANSTSASSSINMFHPFHWSDHLQWQHTCKFPSSPSTCQCQAQRLPQITFNTWFLQEWMSNEMSGPCDHEKQLKSTSGSGQGYVRNWATRVAKNRKNIRGNEQSLERRQQRRRKENNFETPDLHVLSRPGGLGKVLRIFSCTCMKTRPLVNVLLSPAVALPTPPGPPHSPENRPLVTSLSTIQGSFPCSSSETKSGLETQGPAYGQTWGSVTHLTFLNWEPAPWFW